MTVMTLPPVELDEPAEETRVRRDAFRPHAEVNADFFAALDGDRGATRRLNREFKRAQRAASRRRGR